MKLSEFPLMVVDFNQLCIVKPGTLSTPGETVCNRVYSWAHAMRQFGFEAYGDWSVRETCKSAACAGTVVASINGPKGTVEAWNNHEVFFIPRGVKPSKEPNYREIDKANGIVYWCQPSMVDECDFVMRGKHGRFEHDGIPAAKWLREVFKQSVSEACELAGLVFQERFEL